MSFDNLLYLWNTRKDSKLYSLKEKDILDECISETKKEIEYIQDQIEKCDWSWQADKIEKIVNESLYIKKETEKRNYPYIGILHSMYEGQDHITVVKFTAPKTGICIESTYYKNKPNEILDTWDEDDFKEIKIN